MKKVGKIIHGHMQYCRALELVKEKTWSTPWCFEERIFGRKNSPYKSGFNQFYMYRCNITACPAILAVLAPEVEYRLKVK